MTRELQSEIDALKIEQLRDALKAINELVQADTILLRRLLAGMDRAREQRNGYIRNALAFSSLEQVARAIEDCDHEIDLLLAGEKL